MIVHCRYDMTETSSIHCFTRCLTRCFGIERRTNNTKTTAEPAQNGFIHIEEDKPNGIAESVKTCEPNSNGFNKQLRSVGEKTCCVPVIRSRTNESPYIYSQIADEKSKINGYVADIAEDHLSNNIINGSLDNKSSDAFIIKNEDSKINRDTELVSLSNEDEQTSIIIGNSSSQLDKLNTDNKSSLMQSDSDTKLSPYKIHIAVNNMDNSVLPEKDNLKKNEADIVSLLNNETKVCSRTNSLQNHTICVEKSDSLCCKEKLKTPTFNGDCIIEDLEIEKSITQDITENARKTEQQQINGNSEDEHNISYFKNLLKLETAKLQKIIRKWEKVLLDQSDIHEEVCDEIRSVNGQTHLVISERFVQFNSLVEQSEQQASQDQKQDENTKIITLTDLQGFWDMIYYQVQDVIAKFQRLDRIEQNNWNPEILHEDDKKPIQKKVVKKTTNTRKKGNAKSKTVAGQSNGVSEEEKARRIAARKRLAEARKKMAAQSRTQNGDVIMQY